MIFFPFISQEIHRMDTAEGGSQRRRRDESSNDVKTADDGIVTSLSFARWKAVRISLEISTENIKKVFKLLLAESRIAITIFTIY